jgi:hypothetical protein
VARGDAGDAGQWGARGMRGRGDRVHGRRREAHPVLVPPEGVVRVFFSLLFCFVLLLGFFWGGERGCGCSVFQHILLFL